MREIGSEFWEGPLSDNNILKEKSNNTAFLLSGRTAIDFIIKDIKAEMGLKSVMLPSFCCESMIEPFLRNNIEVEFYPVTRNAIEYDFNNSSDAVLLLDFFGYVHEENQKIAEKEFKNGKIVIYDATHKFNRNMNIEKYLSYSFCSFRKWFYCNFATVNKFCGEFKIQLPQKINIQYIKMRNVAAALKNQYINGEIENKTEFLELFSKAEEILENDYFDYCGVPNNFPKDEIISIRKNNAKRIIEGLKDIPQLQFYKKFIGTDDIPLFVPIFTENKIRNDLRNYLIQNNIYCPIHWPVSEYHLIPNNLKEIYNTELSLVCDQRYCERDIDILINTIKKYFGAFNK